MESETSRPNEKIPVERPAIWKNETHDIPVTVIGILGEHEGIIYYEISGYLTGIPETELEFIKQDEPEADRLIISEEAIAAAATIAVGVAALIIKKRRRRAAN